MFPFDEKMANFKAQSRQLVVEVSYTTLKSVISSFKIFFQNYGKLNRKFLRPKKYK